MWDIFSITIFALLLAVGFAGCVLPYPGHLFILGGCALFSWMHGPNPAWYVWVILVLMAIGAIVVDNLCTMMGAKSFGGSKASMWGSLIGIFIGVAFFPIGLIIGAFLGAFIGEMAVGGKSFQESAGAGLGAVVGYIAGIVSKVIIALVMIAVYGIAVWL